MSTNPSPKQSKVEKVLVRRVPGIWFVENEEVKNSE